jgi:hypothetical protein
MAGYIITIAATVGLISVMVMIRDNLIFLGMSKDGLIPPVSKVILSGTSKTNLMI